MKTTLTKLSICKCGFPVLRTDCLLGDEYEIDPSYTMPGVLTCGGCKTDIRSKFVWVHAKGGSNAGFLPSEIFNMTPETPAAPIGTTGKLSWDMTGLQNN